MQRLLPLVIALAAAGAAQAQSSFSIPNPIVKPQSYAEGGRRAAASADSAPTPQVPPLPAAVSQVSPAALPGQSGSTSAPGNDTIIRDTLATFTVTAIVGNRAVLRNNVGQVQMHTTAATPNSAGAGASFDRNQASGSSGSSTQSAAQRQAVIRVKSDVPVFVSGIELTPTVLDSRVEFRIAGRRSVVATVMLESLSPYGYTPPVTAREAADPSVTARVTPQAGSLTAANGAGTAAAAGGLPAGTASNGSAATQR